MSLPATHRYLHLFAPDCVRMRPKGGIAMQTNDTADSKRDKYAGVPGGKRDDPPRAPAYGWVCPKCGAVMAPTTNHCPFCAPPNHVTITC